MKILRVKDDIVPLWDLLPWIHKHELATGDRFAISWKIGKRRKLRSYRIATLTGWDCDCCGWINHVQLSQGNTLIALDNHFGKGYFGIHG